MPDTIERTFRKMEKGKRSPRRQGDLGELSAMEWLASRGAHIFLPVGHSPDVDLIAELGDRRLLRVEVKTWRAARKGDRWQVLLSTRGGNQSWSGLVKYFEWERCDYLLVHRIGDGRRWFIPTCEPGAVDLAFVLGGPKLSPSSRSNEDALCRRTDLHRPYNQTAPRGSTQAVNGVAL